MSAGVASARGQNDLFMVRAFGPNRDLWVVGQLLEDLFAS